VRLATLCLLLVMLATGCGSSSSRKATRIEAPKTPAGIFAGSELIPPRKAPPIALQDAAGKKVTLAAERGRYVLVTFLYVHCPDVCPLIAQNLNQTLRQLGPKRRRVRVLAVSVDPKGDTAAAVRTYVKERGLLPQFRYLIGTAAELRTTWAAWHVLSVRKQRVLYDAQVKARQVLHDLRVLMRSNP
jgi:protein SCO1